MCGYSLEAIIATGELDSITPLVSDRDIARENSFEEFERCMVEHNLAPATTTMAALHLYVSLVSLL